MNKFVLNQSSRITIRHLTSEPVNENWIYHWYACRTVEGCDGTDIFYSITDRNGNSVLNKWISDSFVDYEFFELTPPGKSFWIFVDVDKNDDSEICTYNLEIKVVEEFEPDVEIKIRFKIT